MTIATLMLAAGVQAAEVMDMSSVIPGSQGVCITEMDGGEVVEIPLTVIGTVGPWSAEGEMILVRLENERFRHTGIIAGMSGSPVYVDGKLLGALAFGWSFAKEPIGGVTPFGRMMSLAEGDAGAPPVVSGRPSLVEMLEAGRDDGLGELLTGWLLPERTAEPAGLPLAVTGAAGRDAADGGWLAESWRRLGWVSVPGGGGAGARGELEPGAMVAAVLVDGDAVLAAGGTVTEVRGDEVWAFGHPFLGGGGSRLPMARANVVAVMPSQLSSFKFFSVGETIGSFSVDRSHGIWGRLGEAPPMVPVTVVVDDRRYDYRSIRNAALTPFLVAHVVQSSQSSRGRSFGDQTLALRVELNYRGQEPLVFSETIAAADAPARAWALVAALVAYTENSTFQAPELEAVQIDIATEERLAGLRLVDAVPLRRVVRPGEVLPVRLRLRPHRGADLITRELGIEVPAGTPEGRLDLVVADGAAWSLYDLGMRPFVPASFADEVGVINELQPSTSLIMALERRQIGVALDGGSVAMPPGLVVQLQGGLGSELATTAYAVVETVEEEMGAPVSGAVRIELQVRAEKPLERSEVR
ncbi:MAG: hypothetical protein V2I67_19020 [Thermoanaerobaculales bacterium]|jgi:hypothetical protein|nr:hypothetical protein [Thermoanaerobaculales bacterium]